IEELLVSQPDHGEQALEIADVLIRSGAVDVVAVDSVAALTPRPELEGQMGAQQVGLPAPLLSPGPRASRGAGRSSSMHRSESTSAGSRRSRRAPRRSATVCAPRS